MELRRQFEKQVSVAESWQVLVTVVELPTGAMEVITNTSQIDHKIDYLLKAYDAEFKLRSNPDVRIVGYVLV